MAGFKSKLKLLATRQLRYCRNLISINAEIVKLLEENGITYKDIASSMFLITEPEIIYEYLNNIANNYQNTKDFNIETIINIEDWILKKKGDKNGKRN